MSILEREKADRPNNENSIRGLRMNEDIDQCVESMTIEDFNQYVYKVEYGHID